MARLFNPLRLLAIWVAVAVMLAFQVQVPVAMADSGDSFCFVVSADSRAVNVSDPDGINKDTLQAVLSAAKSETCASTGNPPDFLLFNGDMIHGNKTLSENQTEFQNWINAVKETSAGANDLYPISKVLPGWGGHERNTSTLQLPIRVNIGGGTFMGSFDKIWSEDSGCNTGNVGTTSGPIEGTPDETLFLSARWDGDAEPEMTCSYAVQDGDYLVTLYFAENVTNNFMDGARVFDVTMEGMPKFNGIDIYQEVGGNTALQKTTTVTVNDGQLDIQFLHQVKNPLVKAIEIIPTHWDAYDSVFDVGTLFDPFDASGDERIVECAYYDPVNFGETVFYCDIKQKLAPSSAEAVPTLARIFSLNNDSLRHHLGVGQLQWIKENKSGPLAVFIGQHEPAYGTCAHENDLSYGRLDVPTMDKNPVHRNAYIEEIAPYASMLFSGHEHQYYRRKIDKNIYTQIEFDIDDVVDNADIVGEFFEVKTGTAGAPAHNRIDSRCNDNLEDFDTPTVNSTNTGFYTIVEVDYTNVDPKSGDAPKVYGRTMKVVDSQSAIQIDPGQTGSRFEKIVNEQKLIASGDQWHYWSGTNAGQVCTTITPPPVDGQSRSWKHADYDLTTTIGGCQWRTGNTPMGYGTTETVATTFTNMQGIIDRAYIRRNFTFDSSNNKVPMTLVMDYDDGFVAHINDNEVARSNYDPNSMSVVAAHESGSFERFPLDAAQLFGSDGGSGLLSGRTNHVLAIEGYNIGNNSSDFILTPELRNIAESVTQLPIRVNIGGPTYTDSGGNNWLADTGCNTGNLGTVSGPIGGTPDPFLFLSARWDDSSPPEMTCSYAVQPGDYQATLYFAESVPINFMDGARVFDVNMEGGDLEFDNIDIYQEVGGNTALLKTTTVTVNDGQLDIQFLHQVKNPLVKAIEIIPKIIPAQLPIRVNIGGPTYTDSGGNNWLADTGCNTGNLGTVSGPIGGTPDPFLFLSARWDDSSPPEMTCSYAVQPGDYQATLYFAESVPINFMDGARVFDVNMEGGDLEFDNIDIYQEVGGNTALLKTTTVTVNDGQLDIQFLHQVKNPLVKAIEIIPTP